MIAPRAFWVHGRPRPHAEMQYVSRSDNRASRRSHPHAETAGWWRLSISSGIHHVPWG